MGWSIGFDLNWQRDIGYGVPAWCDHPDCNAEIDRGLSYVCGGEPYGGVRGCGLFFCNPHLTMTLQLCPRCLVGEAPYEPKPEHPRWIRHVLTDSSWERWRQENPAGVAQLRSQISDADLNLTDEQIEDRMVADIMAAATARRSQQSGGGK